MLISYTRGRTTTEGHLDLDNEYLSKISFQPSTLRFSFPVRLHNSRGSRLEALCKKRHTRHARAVSFTQRPPLCASRMATETATKSRLQPVAQKCGLLCPAAQIFYYSYAITAFSPPKIQPPSRTSRPPPMSTTMTLSTTRSPPIVPLPIHIVAPSPLFMLTPVVMVTMMVPMLMLLLPLAPFPLIV